MNDGDESVIDRWEQLYIDWCEVVWDEVMKIAEAFMDVVAFWWYDFVSAWESLRGYSRNAAEAIRVGLLEQRIRDIVYREYLEKRGERRDGGMGMVELQKKVMRMFEEAYGVPRRDEANRNS